MRKLIYIVLLGFVLNLFGQNQYYAPGMQQERNFGIGYTYRQIKFDEGAWNNRLGGEDYPKVSTPLVMNGLSFFGKVGESVIFGVRAFGGSVSSSNYTAESEFWGAMGGVFIDARKTKVIGDWYGSIGSAMYLGRCSWKSLSITGTGIAGHTDALYFEPCAGIGYDFDGIFELKLYWSYIMPKFEANHWSYTREIDYAVVPDGHALNFLLRFYIPTIKNKDR